jgi:DNA modification methylase
MKISSKQFMGSGTAGKAAVKLKRKFIGSEIDEDRFSIARKNIAEFVAETKND